MSDPLYLTHTEIKSFIWHCIFGNGRMVIRSPKKDKAVLDSGRYMLKKVGEYYTSPSKEQSELQEIFYKLIEKYERFEYDGYLYYRVEVGWSKEEI